MKRSRKKGYVVTLDGPSGAGKSTVSKLLARSLGGVLLDTGAMYRGVALLGIESGLESPQQWARLARNTVFDVDKKRNSVIINGVTYGDRLRNENVGEMASCISRFVGVRRVLTSRQREIGLAVSKNRPVVVEGRDIGTVVFPESAFKFFVTATPAVRAKRRFEQLKKSGVSAISRQSILRELNNRDRQDSSRRIAPLRCPKDAVVVDTSRMPISQVVLFLRNHIKNKLMEY